jgi:hypothetical protein
MPSSWSAEAQQQEFPPLTSECREQPWLRFGDLIPEFNCCRRLRRGLVVVFTRLFSDLGIFDLRTAFCEFLVGCLARSGCEVE